MKKFVSIIATTAVILSNVVMPASAEDSLTYSMREKASQSDFNSDGRITTEDVQFLMKYYLANLDMGNTDDRIEVIGDINGDVSCDMMDALFLLLYVNEKNIPGDINEDGRVNSGDASYLLKYIADSSGSTSSDNIADLRCRNFGDINGDDKITATDASLILAYTAELAADENLTLEAFLASRNK